MAAIIFDFDGTIADSFDYVVGFLAQKAGRELTSEECQELRGMSMMAIGRSLGHSWGRLLRLFFVGRRQMHGAMSQVKPFDGMGEVIRKLHAEGHELFIVTSNTVSNVHTFLHHHELHTYFLEVYGGVGLFGKARALRRLLKEQKLEAQDSRYIGDEIRDIKAAQAVSMPAIAVSWGFARAADLEALRPAGVAHEPLDLIQILEEL